MGEMRSLELDGRSVRAYLATPEGGSGPGVLLLHAWWGLTPTFTELADRLAAAGFVVLAPDYYGGRMAATIDEAKALRGTVDRDASNRTVKEASRHLQELATPTTPIGVIAFSLGCGFALELARARGGAVAAVVLFYGCGGGKFDRARAAFLGHFAEDDRWGADARKVRSLAERLRAAECEVTFHTYPGTGHWFFEADRPEAYDAAAAETAWERTVTFLRARLACV
jgi:carboxymethylenebutenolidase